jgi:hypothetical protein
MSNLSAYDIYRQVYIYTIANTSTYIYGLDNITTCGHIKNNNKKRDETL